MIYPDGGRGWGNRDRFLRKAEWQRIVLDGIKSFACTGKRGEKTEVGNEKFPTPPILFICVFDRNLRNSQESRSSIPSVFRHDNVVQEMTAVGGCEFDPRIFRRSGYFHLITFVPLEIGLIRSLHFGDRRPIDARKIAVIGLCSDRSRPLDGDRHRLGLILISRRRIESQIERNGDFGRRIAEFRERGSHKPPASFVLIGSEHDVAGTFANAGIARRPAVRHNLIVKVVIIRKEITCGNEVIMAIERFVETVRQNDIVVVGHGTGIVSLLFVRRQIEPVIQRDGTGRQYFRSFDRRIVRRRDFYI